MWWSTCGRCSMSEMGGSFMDQHERMLERIQRLERCFLFFVASTTGETASLANNAEDLDAMKRGVATLMEEMAADQ